MTRHRRMLIDGEERPERVDCPLGKTASVRHAMAEMTSFEMTFLNL
jgi:hypothetical protein